MAQLNLPPCPVCGGRDHAECEALILVNDHRALLEELRRLVLNHGVTGPESPNLRQRLRALSRVSWLAARIAWLHTDELIGSSGIMAADDPENTGDVPVVRPAAPAVDYAQAQVWRAGGYTNG